MRSSFILTITFLSFLRTPYSLTAQNLIPNPGFESLLYDCDASGVDASALEQWIQPYCGYMAEYYNRCNDSQNSFTHGIPNNRWGNQEAFEGDGYISIHTYDQFIPFQLRSYPSVTLSAPLEGGVEYCFNLHANLAGMSAFGTINMQAIFLPQYPTTCAGEDTTDWVFNAQVNLLTNDVDTTNWMSLSDSFVAEGGELFLTIGDFTNRLAPDTLFIGWSSTWEQQAIYFIDALRLERCDAIGIIETADEAIQLYPNPAHDHLQVTLPATLLGGQLMVYDALGSVQMQRTVTSNRMELDLTDMAAGVYLLRIAKGDELITRTFVLE